MSEPMGLSGIALVRGLLIWLAYKGWSVTQFIANASAVPIMLSIALGCGRAWHNRESIWRIGSCVCRACYGSAWS